MSRTTSALPLRAMVAAIWRERWNQSWRFSRFKLGLWLKLAQLGAVTWIVILFRNAPEYSLGIVIALILGLSVLISILDVFGKQEGQLYSDRFLPFVHISACPPAQMLSAVVLAELPAKAFNGLLTAIVLSNLLPGELVPWTAPLLLLLSVGAGLLGDLTGLLALIYLVRAIPSVLGATRVLVPGVFIALVIYLIYTLASGVPFELIGSLLRDNQSLIYLVASALMLPGAYMGLSLWLWSTRLGTVYRQGWQLVSKRLDTGRNASAKSGWPAMAQGAVGAIQAKEWLQFGRNRITYVRLLFLLAGLIAAYFLGPMIAEQDERWQGMLVLAAGVLVALLSYGEVLAAMFVGEGRNLAFYIISGTHPRHLLIGKMLAALPIGGISFLSVWAFALCSGLPVAQQLSLSFIALLLGFGLIVILVGIAAAGIQLATIEKNDQKNSAEISEQLPSGAGAWAGIGASLLFWLLGSAAGGGELSIGATLALILVLVGLLALAYGLGYARLKRLLLRGR